MKRQIMIAAVAMALPIMIGEVKAQSTAGTTQWLYEQCKSSDPARRDTCSAFLLGVAGIMEILGNTYENPPSNVTKDFVTPYGAVGICSAPLSGADVRQAFISWAEKNPTRGDRKMSQSAMAALQATWPCKMSN
jgi:hypothetical protein